MHRVHCVQRRIAAEIGPRPGDHLIGGLGGHRLGTRSTATPSRRIPVSVAEYFIMAALVRK